jgi:hypothetical protein
MSGLLPGIEYKQSLMESTEKLMKAYRAYLTIKDPKKVVLSDLPFRQGQRIEVVVLAKDEVDGARLQELKDLLKATQSLPRIQPLSEEDITREVEAYRSGQ